ARGWAGGGRVPLCGGGAAGEGAERLGGMGAWGFIVSANVEDTNLGVLPLDPFWRKAEPLDLPVLIHPAMFVAAPRAAKYGLAQVVQYTFDTTFAIGSLLMTGVLDRFPRLKLVLSHGGRAYPYLPGRFDLRDGP